MTIRATIVDTLRSIVSKLGTITEGLVSKVLQPPKTILRFVFSALAALLAFLSVAMWAVSGEQGLHHWVPWVLFCGVLVFVLVVVTVFVFAWNDPTKLQLTPVSGEEFYKIRKFEMGDSDNPIEVEHALPRQTPSPFPLLPHDEAAVAESTDGRRQ